MAINSHKQQIHIFILANKNISGLEADSHIENTGKTTLLCRELVCVRADFEGQESHHRIADV